MQKLVIRFAEPSNDDPARSTRRNRRGSRECCGLGSTRAIQITGSPMGCGARYSTDPRPVRDSAPGRRRGAFGAFPLRRRGRADGRHGQVPRHPQARRCRSRRIRRIPLRPMRKPCPNRSPHGGLGSRFRSCRNAGARSGGTRASAHQASSLRATVRSGDGGVRTTIDNNKIDKIAFTKGGICCYFMQSILLDFF
jgi:hypothetical protein